MSFEDLRENVGLYRCDRCYKKRNIEELVEDEAIPGILVCPTCIERKGFNEVKGEEPKEKYNHTFKA